MTNFSCFAGTRLSSKKSIGFSRRKRAWRESHSQCSLLGGLYRLGLPYIILGTPPTMPYLVRSQVLTGYATLARALGLAPELLAKSVGLDLSVLADLDARISAKAFAELLERSAAAANAEHFGLLMAESRGIGILGPIGIVMREEADLRSALLSLARYLPVHNEALELRLSEERGLAILAL